MEIHKAGLMVGVNTLTVPIGAELLSTHKQGNNLCVWYLVDPTQPTMTEKRLLVVGTGHQIQVDRDFLLFLGTVIDGPFVWHVFELLR